MKKRKKIILLHMFSYYDLKQEGSKVYDFKVFRNYISTIRNRLITVYDVNDRLEKINELCKESLDSYIRCKLIVLVSIGSSIVG